ncbi:MAG: hypothetical protein R2734_05345 [Nocardioides sp.]
MSALSRRLGPALKTFSPTAALAVAGCSGVPTSGPVVEVSTGADLSGDRPAEIAAAPPQPHESQSEIVLHFLDAMMASPIRTSVAREFLSAEAANRWDPEQGTIIYSGQELAPTRADHGVGDPVQGLAPGLAGRLAGISPAESVLRFRY